MENIFDFTMTDTDYIYNINSTTILHITRINHSVAMLYFTDELSNKINVPTDIVVYTYDYQNKKVVQNAFKEEYPLCWTDDYIIELNKNVLINIKNQRKWNIINSAF
jgi:hypothetical protein